MPTDDDLDETGRPTPDGLDLGRLLRSDDSRTDGRLDADAVIRRSRRRRGTKIAGITGAWVLAGALVISGGTLGFRLLAPVSSSGSSSSVASGSAGGKSDVTDGAQPSAAPRPEDADSPKCGSPAPATTTSPNGLSLTIALADTAASGSTITATATLTNSGATALSASAEQPRGEVVRDGVVTWHSPVVPTVSPRGIELAPGASTSFPLAVAAEMCVDDDDNSATLPAASAGDYVVFASIVVHLPSGDEVIVSAPADLRIR